MPTKTVEQQLFGAFLGTDSAGVSRYQPEQFIPRPGNVLAVRAPKITKTEKGIHLAGDAVEQPNYARICAVPQMQMGEGFSGQPVIMHKCPFEVGDVVLFQEGAGVPIAFRGENGLPREDIILLQYTDGIESEIIGKLVGEPVAVEERNTNGCLRT